MGSKKRGVNQDVRNSHIRNLTITGLACVLVFSLYLMGNSKETKDMLQKPIALFKVEKMPFSWAVSNLANQANLPICLETVCIPRGSRRRRINLEMRNATPKGILDALVAKDPRYFWYEESGIINFLPREAKEDKTYPLNRKLSRFKVEAKSLLEVGKLLVTQAHNQAGLTYGEFLFVQAREKPTRGRITSYYPNVEIFYRMTSITLDLKDATLRNILNAIVRQLEGCYWTYTGLEGQRRFRFIPLPGRLDLHPRISFQKRECNFGQVIQGDKIVCRFKLKNIGIDPLEIDDVKTSLHDSTPPHGCPSVAAFDYSESGAIIMPSEEGTIKAAFESEGRKGPQILVLKVYSNDPDNPVTKLIMKGTVLAK